MQTPEASPVDGGQREDFWIAEALTRNSTDVAVYVVESPFIDPSDSFAHGDGQVSRTEIEVACKDCMVGAVAVLGESRVGWKSETKTRRKGKGNAWCGVLTRGISDLGLTLQA